MIVNAGAAELAFHAARVGLGGDSLAADPTLALGTKAVATADEIIEAMKTAPKPVRVSGGVTDAVLRFLLNPIEAGSEAERRFRIARHNRGDELPLLVSSAAPEDAAIVVIAFDNLLRITRNGWREFSRDYWIDSPHAWSADRADSEWARDFGIPGLSS